MFTHVNTPVSIRKLTIRNRVVRTTATSNLGGGQVAEDLIAHHEARARGGVGLTVLDVMSVHPSCFSQLYCPDPRMDEIYPPMIRRLRSHGMKVFQQLWHGGSHCLAMDGGPSWSSCDLPSPMMRGIAPIAMNAAMIAEMVAAFAEGARKCEQWGVDGVEFHAAHGYLAAQFLAPALNPRTDRYGGSLENRSRFTIEALQAMRAAVSDQFIIGIRVGDDRAAGGIHSDEYALLLQELERQRLIDYVSVSIGNYSSTELITADMHQRAGYQLPTSTQITRRVKSPTIVAGRFRTLEEADQVIRAGDADMVALTRAHIADPDLVRKTLAGHAERVRPCIACNQGCIGGLMGPRGRLGCVVNPAAGFEASLAEDTFTLATSPKRVLIVGGGPAGMEAARVAALRGHHVVLAEGQEALGGQLRLAAQSPARQTIFDIAAWQAREVRRLGVDVRLNTAMGIRDILNEGVDEIILATGSTPRMDGVQALYPGEPIRGMERANVVSSHELFSTPPQQLGRRAVLIDDTGQEEAVATVDYLIAAGLEVTLVTTQSMFAPALASSLTRVPALQQLSRGRCNIFTDMRALMIDEEGVLIRPTFLTHSDHDIRVPADVVVFISSNRPVRNLLDGLAAAGVQAIVIGDAYSPRNLQAAIREGYLQGAQI